VARVSDGDDPRSVKCQQRQALLVGLVIAAVPILCQVLMLCSLIVAPDAFPAADRTLTEARFWPIQIVLFCVSVAGTAMVDCVRPV